MKNKIKILIAICLCAFFSLLFVEQSPHKVEAATSYTENKEIVIDTFHFHSGSLGMSLSPSLKIEDYDGGKPTLTLQNSNILFKPGSKKKYTTPTTPFKKDSNFEYYSPYKVEGYSYIEKDGGNTVIVHDNLTSEVEVGWIYMIEVVTENSSHKFPITSSTEWANNPGYIVRGQFKLNEGVFYLGGAKIKNIYLKIGYIEYANWDGWHDYYHYETTFVCQFTNDVSAPKIQGVENNKIYNTQKSITIFETDSSIYNAYILNNTTGEKTYFPDNIQPVLTTMSDGDYYLYVRNGVGLITELEFRIDTTFPIITTSTEYLSSGDILTITSNEPVTLKYNGRYLSSSQSFNFSFTTYSELGLSKSGYLDFIATDEAGNTTEFCVYIDSDAPLINGIDKDVYTQVPNVEILDSGSGVKSINLNGTIINEWNSSLITNTNPLGTHYTITVTDFANNSTTETFLYDNIAPIINTSSSLEGHISKTNKIDITNYVNVDATEPIYITFTEGSATLNGKEYVSGTDIYLDDEYIFIIQDIYGNTDTYYFNINCEAPEGNFNNNTYGTYNSLNVYNKTIKFEWSKDVVLLKIDDAIIYLNGKTYINLNTIWTTYNYNDENIYAFTTKEEAQKYAVDREKTLIEEGIYTSGNTITSSKYGTVNIYSGDTSLVSKGATYYIYKSPSSSTTYVAYFSQESLQTAYTQYAYGSIEENTNNIHTLQLVDKHSRTTEYKFYINPVTPTLEFDNVSGNNDKTNNSVKVTNLITGITPISSMTYSLNGKNQGSFNISTVFTQEGEYVLTIVGTNGLTNIYSFTIDKTAVELKTDDIIEGDITNKNVTFTWAESGCRLFINSVEVNLSSNTYTIKNNSGDGVKVVILIDELGNEYKFEYSLDTVAPSGVLATTQEGGFRTGNLTNGNVTFTWTDDATATLNGQPYSKNTVIKAENTYQIVLTDKAGNTSSPYTFTIDKTADELKTDNIDYDDYTNKNITFYWDTPGCRLYLNEVEVATQSNSYILKNTVGDGLKELILEDAAGNIFKFEYILDTVAPNGVLATTQEGGFRAGNLTNGNVTFTWSDDATATLNGQPYLKNTVIKVENTYQIVLTDKAGNTSSPYTFTIDKTPIEIIADSVTNGGITNKTVTFIWDSKEQNNSLYLNGNKVSVSELGKYVIKNNSGDELKTLILIDQCGNEYKFEYTLDTVAPNGVLTTTQEGGFLEGNITNGIVKYTFAEGTATLNGNPYTSGNSITEDLTHQIILQDLAGNKTTVSFTIDTTPVQLNADIIENGNITNKTVKFSWTENYCSLYLNNEIVKPTASYGSYEYIINKNSGDGLKTLKLIDRIGNIFEFSYTLDTTAPTGTLSGVVNGGFTNQNVSFSCIEKNITATLNGNPYSVGTPITEENTYVLIVSDSVGNNRQYTFTIDKTAVELKTSNVTNGGITNQDVIFSWIELGCKLYLNNIEVAGPTVKTYTIKKNSGDGLKLLKLVDTLGNEFLFEYTLATEAPVYEVYFNGTQLEPKSSYNLRGISIDFAEGTATLNGNSYTSGTPIEIENNYVFEICDILGNKAKFEFSLDYTPYTKNYEYFYNNYYGKINHWWTTYDYILQQQDSKNIYVKNQTYSFASYESAKDYAIRREYDLVETGIYISGTKIWSNKYNCYVDIYSPDLTNAIDGATYYIYKSPSSSTTYVAYFSDANSLQPTYTQYALESIKELNINNSTIVDAERNQNIKLLFNGLPYIYVNKNITFANKPNDNLLYINNVLTNYLTTITEDGLYLIEEVDPAGNSFSYYLCKDTTSGTFKVSDITNPGVWQNQLNTTSAIYVTEPIKIAANDSDPNAILKIEFEDGTIEYCYQGNYYQFNKTGEYNITVIDTAKNVSTTKKIVLSFETPSISFETKYDSEQKPIGFFVRFSAGNSLNKLSSISIDVYDEENEIWVMLSSDDLGNLISNKTNEYYFNKSGQYLVHWIDNFGRNSDDGVPYTLERDKPEGFLTANNQILEPGFVTYNKDGSINQIQPTVTNKSVFLTWNDQADNRYSAQIKYKNGEYITNTYYKGNFISDAGTYIIRLTNNEGAYKDFVFTIDKTPCVANIYTEENILLKQSVINTNFYLSWEEKDARCYYSTSSTSLKLPYYSGTLLTEELTYTFYLYDYAGNESIYTITKDLTPPTVSIYSGNKIVANNSYVNKNVKFIFNEKNVKATVNGDEYISGTELKSNIQYTLVIEDAVGNKATYRVTKDNSPIVITFYNSQNQEILLEKITNEPFKIYVNKEECEITVNGVIYEPGTLIIKDSVYTIAVIDKYQNSFNTTIELDTSSPEGVLTTTQEGGFRDGNLTNGNVSFNWDGYSYEVLLDGSSYSKNTPIKTQGIHTIQITDKAGNSNTYVFEIDKTGVLITLTGVEDGGFTNQNVTINWEEENCIAKLNNIIYNQEEINYESNFTFEIYDKAGNKTTVSFTIDQTAPEGVLATTQEGGFRDGNITNGNVTFTWKESGCQASLNSQPYYSGTAITKNGTYTLLLTDKANNVTEYKFIVDKDIPSGSLIGVSDGGITNQDVTFVWDQDNGYTATLNGQPYTSGNIIAEENTYEIVIYSVSGTSKLYTFTIDKTAPEGVLTTTQEGGFLEGNITNGNVTFTWTEKNCSSSINGEPYTKNTVIKAENTYEIILYDLAGNASVTYRFTIDKTPVTASLTGVSNNNSTNTNVILEFEEDDYFYTEIYNQSTNTTTKVEDNYIVLVEEATYFIYVYDIVGNISELVFTIDKTAPEGVLATTQEGGFRDGNITNGNVTFTWKESGCQASLNSQPYYSGTAITKNGTYTLLFTDKSNNVTEYNFTIDKEIPIGTLVGVSDAGITNKDVSFVWDSNYEYTATLNGNPYSNGSIITDENIYEIIIYSVSGTSKNYSFTIDKTAPEGVLTTTQEGGFRDGNITNGNVSFNWSEINCNASVNGQPYTKNTVIKAENTYQIALTDKAGNTSIYHCEIDKTPASVKITGVTNNNSTNTNVIIEILDDYLYTTAFNQISNETITTEDRFLEFNAEGTYFVTIYDSVLNKTEITFTIDQTAPEGVLTTTQEGGFRDGNITNGKVTFTFTEGTATLNGQSYYKGTVITSEKDYEIILSDKNNNTRIYKFTIDRTAPEFTVNGNLNSANKTKDSLNISWSERNCLATLDGQPYSIGTPITEEGVHYFTLTDYTGNITEFTFEIDRTPATGTLIGVEDGGITATNVQFTWAESGCYSTLDNQPYTKNETIKSIGFHEIILYDSVGNSVKYTFEINKDNPLIQLIGVAPGEETNKTVICLWDSLKNYTATINGEEYINGTEITEEGYYEIIVTGLNQVSSLITFTIDRTAPIINLNGVSNNGTTNKVVKLTWNENLIVTVNDIKVKSGVSYSEDNNYFVVAKDAAGNSSYYSFTIDTASVPVTITGVEENGITKDEVQITWTEEGAFATLNDSYYESGTPITEEGFYKFVITDLYNNSYEITFTIDKTAPEGALTTTQEGGFRENNITNGNISLNWEEKGITVLVNNEPYSKGTIIKTPGTYNFSLIDTAGNISNLTATIDKNVPTITFNDQDGNFISSDIEFETAKDVMVISDLANCKIYLNGEVYDNTLISDNGTYTIEIIYQPTMTKVIYSFTIDKTAPMGTLTGVEDGGITATNVKFSWVGYSYTATLNGQPYTKDTSIRENGDYTIVLTNKLGVSTTYTFTINKVYPTIEFKQENQEPIEMELNKHFNHNIVFECNSQYQYKLDDELITGEILLTEEKEYVIEIKNNQNQLSTVYVFTIDKTAPQFKVTGLDLELGLTNLAVKIEWERSTATLYVNDELITIYGSHTISKNGTYKVKLVDLAGNVSEFEFERFKQDITADMFVGETTTTNDKGEEVISQEKIKSTYTTAVKFVIPEEYKSQLKYKNADGEEVLIDYNAEELTENNYYQLTLSDKFGNTSTFKFRVNIDYSVQEVNYLGQNLALLAIILIPTLGILFIVVIKIVNKKKNPFSGKKKK